LQDWIPHAVIPILGHFCLIVGGLGLTVEQSYAPFAVAGVSTLLLAAGIYGSVDLTLWLITHRGRA